MAALLKVKVIIPERTVFSGDATFVSLPGSDGTVGILPRHERMMVLLGIGEMEIRINGRNERIAIGGGFASVGPDSVAVVAHVAELAAEIDIHRAEEARLRAENAIARQTLHVDFIRLEAALHRAITRIRVARYK